MLSKEHNLSSQTLNFLFVYVSFIQFLCDSKRSVLSFLKYSTIWMIPEISGTKQHCLWGIAILVVEFKTPCIAQSKRRIVARLDIFENIWKMLIFLFIAFIIQSNLAFKLLSTFSNLGVRKKKIFRFYRNST